MRRSGLFRSAVPEAEREGDPAALGSLLHNLGLALDQAGEGLAARAVLQRACELFSSSPDGDQYLSDTLRLLGMVEVELGDTKDGVSHVEQAVSRYQAGGNTDGATRAQIDLGIVLKDAGRLSEAGVHLATALAAARQAGLEKVMAQSLTGLGPGLLT
jgi:Flp pilus assembly protein TadD